MAKLKNSEINQDDIRDYLANSSDFAFEMKVLKLLTEHGCKAEHRGTYTDPITNKDRELI